MSNGESFDIDAIDFDDLDFESVELDDEVIDNLEDDFLDEIVEIDLDEPVMPEPIEKLKDAPGMLVPMEEVKAIREYEELEEEENSFSSIIPKENTKKYVELINKTNDLLVKSTSRLVSLISGTASTDVIRNTLHQEYGEKVRRKRPNSVATTSVLTIEKFAVSSGDYNSNKAKFLDFYLNTLHGDKDDDIAFSDFVTYCDYIKSECSNLQTKLDEEKSIIAPHGRKQLFDYLVNDLQLKEMGELNGSEKGLISKVVFHKNGDGGVITCNSCEENFEFSGKIILLGIDVNNECTALLGFRQCPMCCKTVVLPGNIVSKIVRKYKSSLLGVSLPSDTGMVNFGVFSPSPEELSEFFPDMFLVEEDDVNANTDLSEDSYSIDYKAYLNDYKELYQRVHNSVKSLDITKTMAIAISSRYSDYAFLKEKATDTLIHTLESYRFSCNPRPYLVKEVIEAYRDYLTPATTKVLITKYGNSKSDSVEDVYNSFNHLVDYDEALDRLCGVKEILGMIMIDESIKVDVETKWLFGRNLRLRTIIDEITDIMIINTYAEDFFNDLTFLDNINGKFKTNRSYQIAKSKVLDLNNLDLEKNFGKYMEFMNSKREVFNYFDPRKSLLFIVQSQGVFANLISFFDAIYTRDVYKARKLLESEELQTLCKAHDGLGIGEILRVPVDSPESIDEFYLDNRELFLSFSALRNIKNSKNYMHYALGRDVLAFARSSTTVNLKELFGVDEALLNLSIGMFNFKYQYPVFPGNKVKVTYFLDDFSDLCDAEIPEETPFLKKMKMINPSRLLSYFSNKPKLLEIVSNLDE